jgi:prepilin-type processing-associated H-X9-DG protein
MAPGTHPINFHAAATNSVSMENALAAGSARFWFIRGLDPVREQGVILQTFHKMEVAGNPGPSLNARTRHLNNTTANLLFADGHVASFKSNELIRKLFCVPPPK